MKLNVNGTTSAKEILDNKKIFIPAYQRPYRWNGDQAGQLFSDVSNYLRVQGRDPLRVVNNGSEERVEYFTGATVSTVLKDNSALELIDGQQRTTTFFLAAFVKYLVCARKLREKIDSSSEGVPKAIIDTLDARDLVFTPDGSLEPLRFVNEALDEGQSLEAFLTQYKQQVDSLIRDEPLSCNWALKVEYARATVSEDLENAIVRGTSLVVSDNNFAFSSSEQFSFPTDSYQSTIESCLNWLIETVGDQSSTIALLSKADTLLSNLLDVSSVCNIEAADRNDAYTLFEILNDRSEPLKDLEIAKNLFYRFALQRVEVEPANIDEQLDKAESIWNEAFENSNIEGIVYLAGTMQLTKNYELDFKKGQLKNLREAISEKLDGRQNYNIENTICDFKVYRELGKNLGEQYQHQHRAQAVLKQIFLDSANLTYIAIRYFLALKQEKIVALLLVIIRTNINVAESTEQAKELSNSAALAAFRYSIKSLASIELLDSLKRVASTESADQRCDQIQLFSNTVQQLKPVRDTFAQWSYKNKNHVTVLKTAIAMYAAKNGNMSGFQHHDLSGIPHWEEPSEFDLDHIIPQSKYDGAVKVTAERIGEGSKVHSIGNMMLLGDKVNRQHKSNSVEFMIGEPNTPSASLQEYTVAIDPEQSNNYLSGIRDMIARHNVPSSADRISEDLFDNVRDFNIALIEAVVSLN